MGAEQQSKGLVEFIMTEVDGESAFSEDVDDAAIRIIKQLQAERAALDFLLEQIEKCGVIDDHGHEFTNNTAYVRACLLRSCETKVEMDHE